MKKLITLIVMFSVICTLLSCPQVSAAGTQVVVSNMSCNTGNEVSVEISMPSNAGLVSMLLVINFDSALTLTGVVDGGILGEYNHSNNYKSPYILSWENDRIRENITSTGTLATLKFKVSEDAEVKDYPITITHSELLDKDIIDVECVITNGCVSVNSKNSGDFIISPTPDTSEKDNKLETEAIPEVVDEIQEEPNTLVIYNDVSTNDWFYDCVTELSGKGIISGLGNGAFAPNDNVTREQFLKMLLLAAEIDFEEAENTFTDVEDNAWYKLYVLSAKKLGIVNGISETQFGIGENITRQDMAVMISRTLKKIDRIIDAEETEMFADDEKVSDYAKDAVTFMKSIGLIEGYNNEYRPLDNLTRAEAAKVISELINVI